MSVAGAALPGTVAFANLFSLEPVEMYATRNRKPNQSVSINKVTRVLLVVAIMEGIIQVGDIGGEAARLSTASG